MRRNGTEKGRFLIEIAGLIYRLASMMTKGSTDFTGEYQRIIAYDETTEEENVLLHQQLVRCKNEVESLEKRLQEEEKKKQDLLTHIEELEQKIAVLTKDCNYYEKHYRLLSSMLYDEDEDE